jgi:HK97 family phage prohead protease
MAIEIKRFNGDVTLREKEGRFAARVCAFGVVDKGGDVVQRGAFAASLARWRASNKRIPVVFDHQASDPLLHIGEVNPHDCQETEAGLVVAGRLYTDEERGAKVHTQLKRGTLAEWSFTARIHSARPRPEGGREFLAMELIELGPTLLGKGDTETLMVASAPGALPSPTADELLAPFRARLDVARARIGRLRP